jgi:hypothetical protein
MLGYCNDPCKPPLRRGTEVETVLSTDEPQDPSNRTRRRFLGAAAAGALYPGLAASSAGAQEHTAGPAVDVREFGATGDGRADDTDAFRKAMAAASRRPTGRTVVVPPGTYRVTGTIDIESTLLLGQTAGGWPADSRPMPTIAVDAPAPQPCIAASVGASVHGLVFDYLYRGDPKRMFGPCVRLNAGGVSLTNLLLHNPTEGIMWNGESNIGRLNLENIFIVNPRRCGVSVAYTMDIATLTNVEVWNYIPELLDTCTGFLLGHNDEIRLTNCAVVSAAVGFHFVETKLPHHVGTTWGGMVNCTVDGSGVGIKVDAANILRVSGGSVWAHHFGMVVNGRSNVVVTGADLRANSNHALHVRDCDSVTVSGCLFKKNGNAWPETAKVRIDGGRSVVVSGCTFDENSAGVQIGPGAQRFALTGNLFAKSPHSAIADHSGPAASKVVANNLE